MSTPAELLPILQQIVKLMTEQRDSLAALTRQLTAGPAQRLSQAEMFPIVTFNLPTSPSVLNEQLYAIGLPGVGVGGVDKVDVLVPAGQQVSVLIPARPGTVAVSSGELHVSATYYDPSIVLEVIADDFLITAPDRPFTLTGGYEIGLGEHYFFRRYISALITNNSLTDTTISFVSEGLSVNIQFFDTFYQPLLRYSYDLMNRTAQAIAGGASS